MRKLILMTVVSMFWFPMLVHAEQESSISPRFTIGINVTETPAFLIARSILNWPVTFIPIHLDGSYAVNEYWGVALGLVYRYEDYGRPIKSPFGQGTVVELWTNYHEVFLMAGPRYSFFGQGNRGFYTAFKAGLGGALSSGGFAVTAVGQPEIGYSFIFGTDTSFHLDLAAGVLLNMPIFERPNLGFELSPIGWLVHRTVPIIRVGLGIAF